MTPLYILSAVSLLIGIGSVWYLARLRLRVPQAVRHRLAEPSRVAATKRAAPYLLPPDAELNRLCEELAAQLGVTVGFLTIVTANRMHVRAWCGIENDSDLLHPAGIGIESSVCAYVVAEDDPLVICDMQLSPLLARCLNRVGAYIAAPVHYDGQAIGALGAYSADRHDWLIGDLPLVQSYAERLDRLIVARNPKEQP